MSQSIFLICFPRKSVNFSGRLAEMITGIKHRVMISEPGVVGVRLFQPGQTDRECSDVRDPGRSGHQYVHVSPTKFVLSLNYR